jgi:hypothetical protein
MPFDATPLPALPAVSNPVIELLEAALARIERGWCQDLSAKDEDGQNPCDTHKPAVSFCAIGAICYAERNSDIGRIDAAMRYLLRGINPVNPRGFAIPTWNDYRYRTKDDVVRAYRRAIKIAKTEVFENAV